MFQNLRKSECDNLVCDKINIACRVFKFHQIGLTGHDIVRSTRNKIDTPLSYVQINSTRTQIKSTRIWTRKTNSFDINENDMLRTT